MISEEKLKEAREIFGNSVVNEVLLIVNIFDPDGSYIAFKDDGMEDHMSCIEFLYFEE